MNVGSTLVPPPPPYNPPARSPFWPRGAFILPFFLLFLLYLPG